MTTAIDNSEDMKTAVPAAPVAQGAVDRRAATPKSERIFRNLLAGPIIVGLLLSIGVAAGLNWVWGLGLALGVGMGAAHVGLWGLLAEGMRRNKSAATLLVWTIVGAKLLFIYTPLVVSGLFAPSFAIWLIAGFTVVLFAMAVFASRRRLVALSLVGVLFLSGQAMAIGRPTMPGSIRPESSVSAATRATDEHRVATQPHDASKETKKAKNKEKKEGRNVDLPSLGGWIVSLAPHSPVAKFLARPPVQRCLFTLIFTLAVAFLFAFVARRAAVRPGKLQSAIELIGSWTLDQITSILPRKEAMKFAPFLGGLFLYILTINLSGLIPLVMPSTSFIALTGGLAICVFLVVQYVTWSRLGVLGALYHLAGEPADAITWALSPLMFAIHLTEEFTRPLTLAIRLYGNTLGEHVLLGVMMVLGLMMVAFVHFPVGVPLELPFMFLALLTGSVQALVFSILATIYLALVIEEPDEKARP